MVIPEDIKENVRAVLLSKTDGSGILVSAFTRDYKKIVQNPLLYKNLGFDTLESFLKSIPDVCRLEYSDKDMAYKLFGIAKPNTFVSSFVKRAEGNEPPSPKKGSASNKGDKFTPSSDLNEKWEPSERGLYSLCFPNRRGNGLETKEAVSMKFAQLGEVVEINSIPSLTFVRYRDEMAAKKAIALFGGEIGLRRADERTSKGKSSSRNDRRERGDNSGFNGSNRNNVSNGDIPTNKWGRSETHRNDDNNNNNTANNNDDWDDVDGGVGYVPKVNARGDNPSNNHAGSYQPKPKPQIRDEYDNQQRSPNMLTSPQWNPKQGQGNQENSQENRPRGMRGSNRGNSDNKSPNEQNRQNTDNPDHLTQVYVGNWPNEASERDLIELIRSYKHCGYRIITSKDSQAKKYAFVDFSSSQEAERMIRDLDQQEFHGRTLQVRLGKGKTKAPSVKSDHSPRSAGGIEQEFERLAVHRQKECTMPRLEDTNSSYDRMPHLENGYDDHMPPLENEDNLDEMPPLEMVASPIMPHLSPMGYGAMQNQESYSAIGQKSSAEEMVQVNIGNFPYGTSEHELMRLLVSYGAKNVTMMNNNNPGRSTYAFVDFPDLEIATCAIDELDQSLFKGRRLVATLANPGVLLRPQMQNPLANITCTVGGYQRGSKDSLRHVSVQDLSMAQMSPHSGSVSTVDTDHGSNYHSRQNRGHNAIDAETAFERSLHPNRSNFNYQRLTTTLQDYTKICTKLRADDHFQFVLGMTMCVMITHVENEKFFWGQILKDSENGDNYELTNTFSRLQGEIQTHPRTEPIPNMGRCYAQYKNEWFRAWCTFETEKNGQPMGEVVFIDYGNQCMVPKSEIFKSKTHVWTIPPQARPFKLTEPKFDLDKMADTVVTLEVVEPGSSRTNSVATVRAIEWN